LLIGDKKMEKKKLVSFRLSSETIKQIEAIAKRNSVSQADVISVLVHFITRGDGIELDLLDDMFDIVRLV